MLEVKGLWQLMAYNAGQATVVKYWRDVPVHTSEIEEVIRIYEQAHGFADSYEFVQVKGEWRRKLKYQRI